jgi:hypothetical protein
MPERLTGGLAQAGQWLARKFVRIWKFIARPSGSGSPACAKPLGRWLQCRESASRIRQRDERTDNFFDKGKKNFCMKVFLITFAA